MKFSAIIPCHNNATWIQAALDSVLAQTTPVLETIVLIDSSSDKSEELARAHPLKPTVVKVKLGNAASTRNHGASLAKGNYLAFLDADDFWDKAHLATAVTYLGSDRDVAYFGNFAEIWETTERSFVREPILTGEPHSGLTGDQFYDLFLGVNPGWPTSGMVIETERFRAVGGFDVSQVRRHDTELFSRVVHGRTWCYNPRPTFFYRKSVSGSISTALPECSYYRLLADIKICKLYGWDKGGAHLQTRAEMCLSDILRLSKNRDLFTRAYEAAIPLLGSGKKSFYRGARIAPGLFAWLLRTKHAIAKPRA